MAEATKATVFPVRDRIVTVAKYDPAQKRLHKTTDNLSFVPGDVGKLHLDALNAVQNCATAADELRGSLELSRKETTLAFAEGTYWSNLPTLNDYLDVESLADVEEAERLVNSVLRNFKW